MSRTAVILLEWQVDIPHNPLSSAALHFTRGIYGCQGFEASVVNSFKRSQLNSLTPDTLSDE